jgi:hypothetical protein
MQLWFGRQGAGAGSSGSNIDWIVMRNRRSGLSSRSTDGLSGYLRQLYLELGFRPIDGFIERSIHREVLPPGVCALDDSDQTEPKMDPSPSLTAARRPPAEIEGCARIWMSHLKIPRLDGDQAERCDGNLPFASRLTAVLSMTDHCAGQVFVEGEIPFWR